MIMPVCLPCCLLLFGLLLSLASVLFRRLWGFVRLRLFVFFMDSFFFLSGFQARWPLPLISLLSLLASCFVLSLCYVTYHLFTMPPILPCQPLTFFAPPSKPLLGYVTALLSPSYSVVSCRWSWRLLHGGQDYVGISQYLLFNYYIYILGKGWKARPYAWRFVPLLPP